jgi:hypothetical protein
MSRRTRYQQGSVQREKRLSGSDFWIYRWYETGTDGTSKYRKYTKFSALNRGTRNTDDEGQPYAANTASSNF